MVSGGPASWGSKTLTAILEFEKQIQRLILIRRRDSCLSLVDQDLELGVDAEGLQVVVDGHVGDVCVSEISGF